MIRAAKYEEETIEGIKAENCRSYRQSYILRFIGSNVTSPRDATHHTDNCKQKKKKKKM